MNEIESESSALLSTSDHMNPQCELYLIHLTKCTLIIDKATCIRGIGTKTLIFLTKQLIVHSFIKYFMIQVALDLLKFTQSLLIKRVSHSKVQTCYILYLSL